MAASMKNAPGRHPNPAPYMPTIITSSQSVLSRAATTANALGRS
jgi:hypothetical protein